MNQFRSTRFVILFAAVLYTACSKQPTAQSQDPEIAKLEAEVARLKASQQNQPSPAVVVQAITPQPLRNEPIENPLTKEARAAVEAEIAKCWVTQPNGKSTIEGSGFAKHSLTVKDLKFVTVKEDQLTAADKLNGLAWQGGIYYSSEVYRQTVDGNWREWEEGGVIWRYDVQKKAGTWKIQPFKKGQFEWEATLFSNPKDM